MQKHRLTRSWAPFLLFFAALQHGCGDAPSDETELAGSEEALTAPAWEPGHTYAAGDLVSYNGKVYRCVQGHTSQPGWNPEAVPALWAFEGNDAPDPAPTTPPTSGLTFDYLTLFASCDAHPESCCPPGSTVRNLTSRSDSYSSTRAGECVLALAGRDTVSMNGGSALNLGTGDDTAMVGPGAELVWGGPGNDTINAWGGTKTFFGGEGNDTIMAANGNNTVVPGPGIDTVACGTGDDSVHIFDPCEVGRGEKLDGGTGFDVLYTPLSVEELTALGVQVVNFEKIVLRHEPCRSQCTDHAGCSCGSGDYDKDGVGDCLDVCWSDVTKTEPGQCGCGVPETDSDNDGVPDCVDECPKSWNDSYRGQCGCDGEGAAPAGTPCTDGIFPGTQACDGHGRCGNPGHDPPMPGCSLRTFRTHSYWACPPSTVGEAEAACDRQAGRRLIQIDSPEENAVATALVSGPTWIGAVDRTSEGEWFWLDVERHEDPQFWTGGSGGARFKGRYARWANGAPVNDAQADCATLDTDGQWRVARCTERHAFLCEGVFGPSRDPGEGTTHTPQGPGTIVPGWGGSSNGGGADGGPGEEDCIALPTDPGELAELENTQNAETEACDLHCGPDASPRASETECRTIYCAGAASVPPAGSTCTAERRPLAQLDYIIEGTCAAGDPEDDPAEIAAAQDCSGVTIGGFSTKPTRCGVQTRCFFMETGTFNNRACTSSSQCAAGDYCDAELGKCVDPELTAACEHADTSGVCKGQCFARVGCGLDFRDLLPFLGGGSDPDLCEEKRFCGPETYTAGLNDPDGLAHKDFEEIADLPDESETPEPVYSGDFATPALGSACSTATCTRGSRHSWCTNDPETPGSPVANVRDDSAGDRGNVDSVVQFKVDPVADLDFTLNPLPYGAATFDLTAAAAVQATAGFDLRFVSATIELVDLRASIEASLCHVSTEDTHLEVLGVDFVPDDSPVIFNTDKLGVTNPSDPKRSERCEKAVAKYVDTFDRAKKALRDAQELIRQYNDLKALGHTFGPEFCEAVAGAGKRPPGMPGSCASETPENTINRFIDYYSLHVFNMAGAVQELANSALDTNELRAFLGQVDRGFDFYADLGSSFSGEETTTLLATQFFIGPIPCVLEISSYLNYGVAGGFGASLKPGMLLRDGGRFAEAGVVVTPYADAGVTLFVGAGFNIGPLSLSVGVEGGVTLANVDLPASVSAGLSMIPEVDDRDAPTDLSELSNGYQLFPFGGIGQRKYGFHFDFRYGVDLALTNMLDGHLDGAVKVKFFFFSRKWRKRLATFDIGLDFPQFNLIGGGVELPVVEGVPLWKFSYGSVPLLGLKQLDQPREPLVADGTFSSDRVSELFYDSLCQCIADGEVCNRDDDCCGDFECGGHAGPNGEKTCSAACAEEGEVCQTIEDCCPGAEDCRSPDPDVHHSVCFFPSNHPIP
jgi:hypothetical protein